MKLTYTKGVDNKDILVGDEQYQVMMEWEKPYMEALVDRLNPSGDVLEIGFGLGYSADAIQKYDINTHTIIECDPVVLVRLKQWAKQQKHKVIIVEGSWQKVLHTLDQRFDSIFMDDYPFHEYPDPRFVRTFHFYFSIIKRNVNKDARFTFFCSNPVTWPCTMWMEWSSEVYNIIIPDDVDDTHSQATDNKLYLPLITFKESSPIFIHPIVIEKFIKGNQSDSYPP